MAGQVLKPGFHKAEYIETLKSNHQKAKVSKKILRLSTCMKKMSKPSEKAQRNYQKYPGKMVFQAVKKHIPDLTIPAYYNSNYYVRTGNIITLKPDEEYFKLFSNDPNNPNIWQHHLPRQYLFLVEKLW